MAEPSVEQGLLFDERFVEMLVGKRLVDDPKTALMELVANAWDAGSTQVTVQWPENNGEDFWIEDNGHGMTEEQFLYRWRTLAYNRLEEQGRTAEYPPGVDLPDRQTFGRNGIGRFAAFCFGGHYRVRTARDGEEIRYRVEQTDRSPLQLTKLGDGPADDHGTRITVPEAGPFQIAADTVRAEVGMRFLLDPNFEVGINGQQVAFGDIPENHKETLSAAVDDLGEAEILVIDTRDADRTTKQHGIAWHVMKRLVGDCSWRGFTDQAFLDGRSTEAKRFTFFVFANFLREAVLPDWSGFDTDDERFLATNEAVSQQIRDYLEEVTSDQREEQFEEVRRTHSKELSRMGPISKSKWSDFVRSVQRDCPTIGADNLKQLAGILANLELASTQYGLIDKLHSMDPDQLDNLHEILDDWTVDMAKQVLDELQGRLRLLDTLKEKVFDESADEVQELQPLFRRGLWIFGPEFETIEFTSNEGMTTVIQRLFGSDEMGSRNRPDFAILPNSTAGFYSYPRYRSGSEEGVEKLVVVELKRAGVEVGLEELNQAWKYIKELKQEGYLQQWTTVEGFVLGSEIDPLESSVKRGENGSVEIRPLHYNTVIERARSRLLNLYDRVREAPFLADEDLTEFEDSVEVSEGQPSLALDD